MLTFRRMLTHTLSPLQMAAGKDRRITHAIAQARDAIFTAGKSNTECGIADLDYEMAFDFLSLNSIKLVLQKKGVCKSLLQRFSNIYSDGITIPIVNNEMGGRIPKKECH